MVKKKVNNFKLKIIFTVILFFSSISNSIENNNFYFQINGAIASGLPPKGDYGDNKSSKTMLIGAEAGYQFNQQLRLGLSLDYIPRMSFKENTVTIYDEDLTAFDNYTYKIKSFASMLNVYYDIIEINKFIPYVTLGAGIARNKSSGHHQREFDDGEKEDNKVIPNATQTNFAYKIGLGARYSINKTLAFDLRYQFVDLGKLKTGIDEDLVFIHYGKLKVNQFLLGIAYKF